MKRFIESEDRSQSVLFPERLGVYIGEDNPVRAIDAFVEELDLADLGFEGVLAEESGRLAYHPASLLRRDRTARPDKAIPRVFPQPRLDPAGREIRCWLMTCK